MRLELGELQRDVYKGYNTYPFWVDIRIVSARVECVGGEYVFIESLKYLMAVFGDVFDTFWVDFDTYRQRLDVLIIKFYL